MSKLEQFIAKFPWVRSEEMHFAKLGKDLKASKVALVSTGGLYAPGDEPFAIVESADVDESYREIPANVPLHDLKVAHEHYNRSYAAKDMNSVFPLERLRSLADEGFIGAVAETNYSITGYIPNPEKVFESGRHIAKSMQAQGVDVAVIVPV